MDSLRPLLLFLQQWCFRQKEKYYAGLQAVTSKFAPLLLPLSVTTGEWYQKLKLLLHCRNETSFTKFVTLVLAGRQLQAQQALAWIISNAFNIFKPTVDADQPASAGKVQSVTSKPSTNPVSVPPAPTASSVMRKSSSLGDATAVTSAASKVPECEHEPWMEPAFQKFAIRLIAETVSRNLFEDMDDDVFQQEPIGVGAVVETSASPGKVPLPAMPAWAAPVTTKPLSAASLAALEEETGVLCILRTPTKAAKSSMCQAGMTIKTPPSDKKFQRSASAPLVASESIFALAAVASQLSSVHAMLQEDFGSSKSSGALGLWRRSSSLESVALLC